MSFRIRGLDPEPFRPLFAMPEEALRAHHARRSIAGGAGYPCRVSLEDAEPGETVVLANFGHLDDPHSPYRGLGPVYVRETAMTPFDSVDIVPQQLASRLLSVRAYDAESLMVDAEVLAGEGLGDHLDRLFARSDVAFAHAHFARQGCYAARADRH